MAIAASQIHGIVVVAASSTDSATVRPIAICHQRTNVSARLVDAGSHTAAKAT